MFCLPGGKASADLEIDYPKISGQNLSSDSSLPDFVKYLYNFGMGFGFLCVIASIAYGGLLYIISPLSAEIKANAMDRIYGAISGFLVLLTTYLIVTTINPQLSVFNLNKQEVIQMPAPTKTPGVYLNNGSQAYFSSVPDLGSLKNKVKSVDIVQDSDSSYLAILYNNVNFSGKCQWVSWQKNDIEPFASSISIHQFNSDPNGDGVYFFRKPCLSGLGVCQEKGGGWLKIKNADIVGGYNEDLVNLKFNDVPEQEQDCAKYKGDGKCADGARTPPSLGGENISYIIIKGNYVVLLVYQAPNDSPGGPWTLCQEFPTVNDTNKTGPQQIKWQHIRNSEGLLPNGVIIIPI